MTRRFIVLLLRHVYIGLLTIMGELGNTKVINTWWPCAFNTYLISISTTRVLSRNRFWGGKMVGEVHPRVWVLPPRKMLVCLDSSTSIHQRLLAGKNLLYAIILYCNWEKFGGEAWVFGGEASSPPSRLNPDHLSKHSIVQLLQGRLQARLQGLWCWCQWKRR